MTRTLADLSFEELQEALIEAKADADFAKYADSNTPKRKADARVSAIEAEIAHRQRRSAT